MAREAHKDSREMTLIITHGKGNRLYYKMADNPRWTMMDGTQPFWEVPPNAERFTDYKRWFLNSGLEADQPYWVWSVKHPMNGKYYWVAMAPLNRAGVIDWSQCVYYNEFWKPREREEWENKRLKNKPKTMLDLLVFDSTPANKKKEK